jgi:hypothetical protein
MRTLHVRNVNEAFDLGVRLLGRDSVRVVPSRVGEVREWPAPVATVYDKPCERVLWEPARAANPFFHFFESMWMLSGGSDVAFVEALLPRMREYSDDGETMQGAYGWRWRTWFDVDQIAAVVAELAARPESRRGVIAMWDPGYDLKHLDSKDIPCNTTIYFKLRDGALDMTVCNRSNDMLWGAYGANAVHMSFLQEYVANKLKAQVGVYTQFSDSFHVYTGGPGGKVWERVKESDDLGVDFYKHSPAYSNSGPLSPYPLHADEEWWDDDMYRFFALVTHGVVPGETDFRTSWWTRVVAPLWQAYYFKDPVHLTRCAAADWRVAGYRWFHQQKEKSNAK